jgi:hypothetical protein
MRTLAALLLTLGAAVMAVRATARQGTTIPPPPPPPGPEVFGTVRLPNGILADMNRSTLERFAALVAEEAEALTSANVRVVGRNVSVQLSLRRGDGTVQALETSFTNDQGQFLIDLPAGTSEDTCRFIVSVGSGPTLTRAFVYSTMEPIIVDYASETTVALILGQVQQGADFCGFSAGEIRSLVNCIRTLPGDVTAANVFETNHNALLLAANALQAGGVCFSNATPGATVTPALITTPTPTPVAPPCVGDCGANGAVTVDEIVRLVNIVLNGETSLNTCPGAAQWCNGPLGIEITCVIGAVNNALSGCPLSTSTPSPTPLPLEAPCTSSLECESAYCIDGRCCNLCLSETLPCACDGTEIPYPTPLPGDIPESCDRGRNLGPGLWVQDYDACRCLPRCFLPAACPSGLPAVQRTGFTLLGCACLSKCPEPLTTPPPTPTPCPPQTFECPPNLHLACTDVDYCTRCYCL